MNNHGLAIVIPAYKVTFLSEVLDSIAAQTCQDFTLYVGDDCSPSDIKSVVDGYRDSVNLVYQRFEENLGGHDLVAQWERCIAMSNDEPYIWLFSDDDVMEPNCVEELLKKIDETKSSYDLYHFDIDIVDEFGRQIGRQPDFPSVISSYDYYKGKSSDKYASYAVEFVFSRRIYNHCNGFKSFDLAWGSDVATWCMFSKNKGICSIRNARVHWRQSSENITPDYTLSIAERKIAAHTKFFCWAYRFFHEEDNIYVVNRSLFIYKMQTYRKHVSKNAFKKAFDVFFYSHGHEKDRKLVFFCASLPHKVFFTLRRFNIWVFQKNI